MTSRDPHSPRSSSTSYKAHLVFHLDAVLDGLDATGICEQTRSGKVTVQDVTQHFLNRASIVHQATNCLSHFFPEKAMQRAKQLDDKRSQLEKEGRLDELGPLFGLPMSIKGHMH